MFSGKDGRIKSSSSFTALVTFRTLDFVCLTTPKPIALSPFALRKPLSLLRADNYFRYIAKPNFFVIKAFYNNVFKHTYI